MFISHEENIIILLMLELKVAAAKRALWQAEFEGLLAQVALIVKRGEMLCL